MIPTMYSADNTSRACRNDYLTISSFNCHGFNDSKIPFMNKILTSCDFLCLQEHWLPDKSFHKLSSINSQFLYTTVSGFDSSTVLKGRPFGGCAILWNSRRKFRISTVQTNSNRICCIRVESDTWKLLLINVYMPYEGSANHADEYLDQLCCIDFLLNSNSDCHAVVCGDMNADPNKDSDNFKLLSNFCSQASLHMANKHLGYSVDYSYHFNMLRFSTLDHFILSNHLFMSALVSCEVCHDCDNLSDHDPISLKLNISVCDTIHSADTPQPRIKLSWHKVKDCNIERYKQLLTSNLNNIKNPKSTFDCYDTSCSSIHHLNCIDQYYDNIKNACLKASYSSIPRTSKANTNRIAGWNEQIEPLRDKSIFWHNLWRELGRPATGTVACIMRSTRAIYHRAIKKVRADESSIRKERLAECVLNNHSRDFWKEIKQLNHVSSSGAVAVDGISDSSSVANMFADKYQNLYNCVPFDKEEMDKILISLNEKLCSNSSEKDRNILFSKEEITNAIANLKPNKNDGSNDLSTNHLKFAPIDLLSTHLSNLFSLMLIHGHVPSDLLRGTTIPIPKGNGANLTSSDNYRGITLVSVFSRIIDLVILNRYIDRLCTSELQFGFKRKCSTNMCSFVLKETVSYYISNQTPVYCVFLDASKAFDKVEYCLLFNELCNRNLPALIIRLLLNMYVNQKVCVSWKNVMSNEFSVCNGVKQGAIISPVLFCIYFDNLMLALKREGIGCHIGSWFVGGLAYADDVALLAPSASALRRLLTICESFAQTFHVTFNALKSKCIVFGKRPANLLPFTIGNDLIEFVNSWPHLGHVICNNGDDADDISGRKYKLFGQVNNLICNFSRLDFHSRCKLFFSFCCSHYGCELWDLGNKKLEEYCSGWRRGLRRFLGLPYDFNSQLLHCITDSTPIIDELYRRNANFILDCLNSPYSLVSLVANHSLFYSGSSSAVYRNIMSFILKYNTRLHQLCRCNSRYFCSLYFPRTDSCFSKSAVEIIRIRDGLLSIPGITLDHPSSICFLSHISSQFRSHANLPNPSLCRLF